MIAVISGPDVALGMDGVAELQISESSIVFCSGQGVYLWEVMNRDGS